ncbi:MAG TPA: hypothetical protein VI603_13390 [Saprospiraceae bacterium]|nr:hypothetical protein [Saprospiraceae bacterium]
MRYYFIVLTLLETTLYFLDKRQVINELVNCEFLWHFLQLYSG